MDPLLFRLLPPRGSKRRNTEPEGTYELCASCPAVAQEAFRIGYDVVALDFRIQMENLARDTKLDDLSQAIHSARKNNSSQKLLARATIILDGPRLEIPKSLLNTVDLVAVCPQSEAALLRACATPDVDIITIDSSKQLLFALHRAPLLTARKRGACFEVNYENAESTSMRHLVSVATHLARTCHGKGVILSSGNNHILPPKEVNNIAKSLTFHSQPHLVISHAAARRRPTWAKPLDLGLDDVIFANDDSIQHSRACASKARLLQARKRQRRLAGKRS